MTTWEPGARLVLTQGCGCSPRSTALRATRPAASITDGLDVLVQLVIAAIITSPWPISTLPPPADCGVDSNRSSMAASPDGARSAWPAPFTHDSTASRRSSTWLPRKATSDLRHADCDCDSGTRSWGRLGPASDGTTSPRSSSRVAEKRGSGDELSRNSPCSTR